MPESSTEQQFMIQRIYIADLSFEAPSGPSIFQETEWKPEMHLDINTSSKPIQENLHNVVLALTITVKMKDKVAFLIEIKQAGIFHIKGFPEDQLKRTLGSFCPNLLYPYARAAVSKLVSDGGFPQLILSPINFDALYNQHLQEEGKQSRS